MFATERQNKLYLYLTEHHSAMIRDMAQYCDVSETTIRRDLAILEKSGVIERKYGGAVVVDSSIAEPPYRLREHDNPDIKSRLAELACGLVRNGELIFMDTSSTVNSMTACRRLDDCGQITVVSNCIKTVMQLSARRNFTVYCSGGKMRDNSNSILGVHADRFFDHFYADTAFLSCRGLDISAGITEASEEEAQLKRKLLSRARQTVLLCDSSKIGKSYSCFVADLSCIDILITDYQFNESERDLLQQKQVTLLNCS